MQHEPVEELPKPTPLSGMEDSIGDLGAQWARESSRPRVTRQTLEGWHALLHDWIADESIPLLIRKASVVRGSEVIHSSGRIIVPTDNSPAQWACYLAVTGIFPSIDESSIVSIAARFECHSLTSQASEISDATMARWASSA